MEGTQCLGFLWVPGAILGAQLGIERIPLDMKAKLYM